MNLLHRLAIFDHHQKFRSLELIKPNTLIPCDIRHLERRRFPKINKNSFREWHDDLARSGKIPKCRPRSIEMMLKSFNVLTKRFFLAYFNAPSIAASTKIEKTDAGPIVFYHAESLCMFHCKSYDH